MSRLDWIDDPADLEHVIRDTLDEKRDAEREQAALEWERAQIHRDHAGEGAHCDRGSPSSTNGVALPAEIQREGRVADTRTDLTLWQIHRRGKLAFLALGLREAIRKIESDASAHGGLRPGMYRLVMGGRPA